MLLAGDVGGTKVNLGLFEVAEGRVVLKKEGTRPSRNYARFDDLVRELLAEMGNPQIHSACFGVAGPVKNARAQLTNLPWRLDAAELAQEFSYSLVSLINDLEANAYGLAELSPADLCSLNAGEPDAVGNMAMISAGTGLGEAGLFWDGTAHRVFASEGGHADFAPANDLDAEFFAWLKNEFGHVSWEKVLSGLGLANIHKFLSETKRGEDPANFAALLASGDPGRVDFPSRAGRNQFALRPGVGYVYRILRRGGGQPGVENYGHGRRISRPGGLRPKILAKLQNQGTTGGAFFKAFVEKGADAAFAASHAGCGGAEPENGIARRRSPARRFRPREF